MDETDAILTADDEGKPKSRGGAPRSNRNALRHGLRSVRSPAGCLYIDQQLASFRRHLEDAIIATHGEVSIHHSAVVLAALRTAGHAMKAGHWLRQSWAELSWEERLKFDRETADYMSKFERHIASLKLEQEASDGAKGLLGTFEALHRDNESPPFPQDDPASPSP
jgi:hypothetical protein